MPEAPEAPEAVNPPKTRGSRQTSEDAQSESIAQGAPSVLGTQSPPVQA